MAFAGVFSPALLPFDVAKDGRATGLPFVPRMAPLSQASEEESPQGHQCSSGIDQQEGVVMAFDDLKAQSTAKPTKVSFSEDGGTVQLMCSVESGEAWDPLSALRDEVEGRTSDDERGEREEACACIGSTSLQQSQQIWPAVSSSARQKTNPACEEDSESSPCQFAPLMQVRRAQAIEEGTAVGTGRRRLSSDPLPAEDLLLDALEAMDALREAEWSSAKWSRKLDASSESGEPKKVPLAGGELSTEGDWPPAAHGFDTDSPKELANMETTQRQASFYWTAAAAAIGAASAAGAAASSVAEALLSATAASGGGIVREVKSVCSPVEKPCVEGLLSVQGDLDFGGSDSFREALLAVIAQILAPLFQTGNVELTGPFNVFRPQCEPMCHFNFRVFVLDPHDVDPLRETLLLEAESGGARSLLPLLAEQLCDNDISFPRHLKIRLEVRGAK
eukprot:TRINITY_DN36395_c0_g1_i2.p1 TRINITY_DN36395_c0_g1~~TRINITY_DN36395_c0_g1_i2.p1  ORF type:complete len:448 (+),score=105.35 TRINITY_DN36395_c0_g1_i2:232-1575(+)